MKTKICGINQPYAGNFPESDYTGFIFYSGSPRNCTLSPEEVATYPGKKVGVFVNASPEEVIQHVEIYHLDAVQLHGDENPDYCKLLHDRGIEVIKAFSVSPVFQFEILEHYAAYCALFLFDARGEQRGGNGVRFDWNLLKRYSLKVPFLLSGGIGPEHVTAVASAMEMFPNCLGIDVNSRFETAPGKKDLVLIQQFFNALNIPV
jgi:phosphoribosylanthranilate isomerase